MLGNCSIVVCEIYIWGSNGGFSGFGNGPWVIGFGYVGSDVVEGRVGCKIDLI